MWATVWTGVVEAGAVLAAVADNLGAISETGQAPGR